MKGLANLTPCCNDRDNESEKPHPFIVEAEKTGFPTCVLLNVFDRSSSVESNDHSRRGNIREFGFLAHAKLECTSSIDESNEN